MIPTDTPPPTSTPPPTCTPAKAGAHHPHPAHANLLDQLLGYAAMLGGILCLTALWIMTP